MCSDHDETTVGGAALAEAILALGSARDVVVLTGAGVSVESGIPDFRSVGGLWERFDPFEYATRGAFREDPHRCWQLFDELGGLVRGAIPNAAHLALARWETHLARMTIVTQNIDGLHQKAGCQQVLEFHGGASALLCIDCGARFDAPAGRGDPWPPLCACGKVLKPDIVLFGDPIPMGVWERSVAAIEGAEGVLVIGTSAQVAPFSELPWIAARGGLPVVEINLEPTGLSRLPTIFVEGAAGAMVPALVGGILGG